MYDHVLPLAAMRELFVSPEGNVIDALQTKTFSCELSSYYLYGGRLYKFEGEQRGSEPPERQLEVTESGLLLTKTERRLARPVAFTGTAHVYSHDTRCLPVLLVEDPPSSLSGDKVRTRFPWCQWAIQFSEGSIDEVAPVAGQMQSRADLIATLQKQGVQVLPDTDFIAQERFKRFRAAVALRDELAPPPPKTPEPTE